MNAEFFSAIEDLEKEKGIPRDYMYDKIRQAMLAAFRKDNPECADNVEILLDEDRKRIEMYVNKTAVEQVGVQFNTACAALIGSDRICGGAAAAFKCDVFHKLPPYRPTSYMVSYQVSVKNSKAPTAAAFCYFQTSPIFDQNLRFYHCG